MKLLKTFSAIAALSLNVLFALPVSAQLSFDLKDALDTHKIEREKEVMQDNELEYHAKSIGTFFSNPLQLNGHTVDYSKFSIKTEGELTLVKGNPLTGDAIQIPFYVYLRRDGNILELKGEKALRTKHLKLNISTILKHAEPGDQLIIKPANREDWQAKRIVKLLGGGGC
jgi:hypothetical protein